jgi:hypothetical protein
MREHEDGCEEHQHRPESFELLLHRLGRHSAGRDRHERRRYGHQCLWQAVRAEHSGHEDGQQQKERTDLGDHGAQTYLRTGGSAAGVSSA